MRSRLVTGVWWLLLTATSAGLGTSAAAALHRGERGETAARTVTVACALALVALSAVRAVLRRRGQREWRETAGRAQNPAQGKHARPAERNSARLDRHDALLAVLAEESRAGRAQVGELTATVSALAAGLEAAHRHREAAHRHRADGAPPQRHLRTVRDDDTKPLPAAIA
jgi:hypothetical protein